MLDDMELLDTVYAACWKNAELTALLGNPTTPKARSERIHREITPMSYATADNVNFISMYFSSATETDNIYAIRGFLTVDYYCKSHGDIKKLKRIVTQILQDMDIFCTSRASIASDVKGVFIYSEKYRPLIWA
jgi:hypothetical protein|nr:MAG TPA: hypothetical protein [Caudoviricetes sp.]